MFRFPSSVPPILSGPPPGWWLLPAALLGLIVWALLGALLLG